MTDAQVTESIVEREAGPFGLPSKLLAVWLFIASDSVTFGAILYGYGYVRNAASNWPTPFHFAPTIINVLLMTIALVTSSLTMSIAVQKAKAGLAAAAFRYTIATVALGVLFALLHAREWVTLVHEGVTPAHNPWGAAMFGGTFFAITGMHLLHVVVGVCILLVVALGYKRGRYDAADLEVWGVYWHFVDIVWMFVVPLVYLLNIQH